MSPFLPPFLPLPGHSTARACPSHPSGLPSRLSAEPRRPRRSPRLAPEAPPSLDPAPGRPADRPGRSGLGAAARTIRLPQGCPTGILPYIPYAADATATPTVRGRGCPMDSALQALVSRLDHVSDEFRELREGVQKAVLVADVDPEMAL